MITGRVADVAAVPGLAALPVADDLVNLPQGIDLLVVVGGGRRMDAAKAWRGLHRPTCDLLALPTRFGSGAEANGIAVLDDRGAKTIHIGAGFRPTYRSYWPPCLDTLSDDQIAWSIGDALSHAVEGVLSPLASPLLRTDLADVLIAMLRLGPSRESSWFELSALASAGQAQASVGLVHGLAHVLEAPIRERLSHDPGHPGHPGHLGHVGHARLCAACLAPVLRFNLARSGKAAAHFDAAGIDVDALLSLADALSGPARDLPLDWSQTIETHWPQILRDPCTRTNVATVRPGTLPELLAEFAR